MRDFGYKIGSRGGSNFPAQLTFMKNNISWIKSFLLIIIFSLVFAEHIQAQHYLSRPITLEVKEERLGHVLERIERMGGFYFSYESTIIAKDSLVTLTVRHGTIEQLLNNLLEGNYEYKEARGYIILRLAPNRLQLMTADSLEYNQFHSISGFVVDDLTGTKIQNASVYEKSLLLSTLTDTEGYFKLKINHPINSLSLTISKEYYRDTTITFLAPAIVNPRNKAQSNYGYQPLDELQNVERTAMGRFFVSSKQKLQSLNLGAFFANTPFQTSFTPGLSTHGSLSGQVINNFSVNILGGYTSGVNGIELGGGFNINKRDVDYLQAGGLFNLVGGSVHGVQMAGGNNTVLDSVKGVQISGIYNNVKGSIRGMQMTGGVNRVNDSVIGVQIAGIGNLSHTETKGLQIGGLFNYSKNLKGVQIGLVNVADTSSGLSIGLLNFIGGGYHKVSLSNNDFTNFNIAYKSGNSDFYTTLIAGINLSTNQKAFTFGAGFGHDFIFNEQFSLSSELFSQNVYLGSWKELNNLYRAKATFNLNLSKGLGVFAGPVFNVFVNDQTTVVNGYKDIFSSTKHSHINFDSKTKGWLGWEIGITLF